MLAKVVLHCKDCIDPRVSGGDWRTKAQLKAQTRTYIFTEEFAEFCELIDIDVDLMRENLVLQWGISDG